MRIALDVDDCIANWYKAACEYSEVEYKVRNHWDEVECSFILANWMGIQDDENFWYNLEKLNGVDFEFDCYITSIPAHLGDSRLDWLNRHGFPEKPIFFEEDKVGIAEELGIDVIIDDKPATIKAFIDAGKHAIHYIPPYSSIKPVSPYHTKDFSEIPKLLTRIKEENYDE